MDLRYDFFANLEILAFLFFSENSSFWSKNVQHNESFWLMFYFKFFADKNAQGTTFCTSIFHKREFYNKCKNFYSELTETYAIG